MSKRRTGRRKRQAQPKRVRIELCPYQRRWAEDESRFKIACKARQIGFTFAAAYRVVHKRLAQPGLTLWISASERQALEAMEHVRHHINAANAVASYVEEFVEGTQLKQHTVRFPNGSRIVALPANPDTVRGFAGDVVLDEFAFHRDADAIWRAAFATATRGFQLEIISTPNSTRGKYYELAKAAGLVDYIPEAGAEHLFRTEEKKNELARAAGLVDFNPEVASSPSVIPSARERSAFAGSVWSPHWADLSSARTQGFVVDVESLRAAIADEDAWQQEYCCRFLSQAAHYIPPELVVAAEHPAATTTLPFFPAAEAAGLNLERPVQPGGFRHRGLHSPLYLGVDIGRRRDLTVLWLLEVENEAASPEARIYWTRSVVVLDRQPFTRQRQVLDAFLALRPTDENRNSKIENRSDRTNFEFRISRFGSAFAVRRCAMDASGLGTMLAEELQQKWGARVEPVHFTLAVKEDLAVRVKRLLEDGRLRLPYDPAVRAALGSVKRYVTPAGNIRFDADRTERAGHADHFWALALALLAAEQPSVSVDYISTAQPRPFSQAYVF